MRKLSLEVQYFLQCVACLGSSFTLDTICMVWEHQTVFETELSSTETKLSTDELLASMVSENYLEKTQIGDYRWTHDNIEQAAFSLIEAEGGDSFRREIGRIWYRQLGEKNLDTSLFEVANLLNNTATSVVNTDYAKLNLKAAQKAKDIAAFESCKKYAANGINMLPTDKWISQPDLTLKLFSLAAEAEEFLGYDHGMNSYCNEVLSQKSISVLEKKDVFTAKLLRMSTTELRHEDAVDFCLTILKDLGCILP
eukprot:901102-Ditylum_brightwellii.AAC.1